MFPEIPTKQGYSVQDGLATLGPSAVHIMDLLERNFLAWAAECGASPMLFPPLMRVADLRRFDYFKNFPHLGLGVAKVKAEAYQRVGTLDAALEALPAECMEPDRYFLSSAACYNVYLHLAGARVTPARYVTTVARCYRNEEHYADLKRLWCFTMREIVCVGDRASVLHHLSTFREKVVAYCKSLGLPVTVEAATDPFFDKTSSVAVLQRAFPTKEEFVFGGELSIGSVNFHRNYFGERCDIKTEDSEFAFTGCVAFGLERWLHALLQVHGGEVDTVIQALTDASSPTKSVQSSPRASGA